MTDAPKKPTLSIVILLGLELISLVLAVPQYLLAPAVRSAPTSFKVWIGANLFIVLLCMWGYFRMKRAGVIGYALLTLVNQYMYFRQHTWSLMLLAMPGIVIAVGVLNWREMD